MAVNRDLYSRVISETKMSPWTCGLCGLGTLRLIKKSFDFREGASKLAHQEDWFDYEMIQYRFSCFAECSSDTCQQIVTITGSGTVYEDFGYDHGTPYQRYEDHFLVDSVRPAPRLFVLSDDLPTAVVNQIFRAFGLFWVCPSAALNSLRTALERSLDELSVPKFELVKTKAGNPRRRQYLSLHKRINKLPSKYDDAKKILMASKWITNAGSHTNDITDQQAFDAFDLTEQAINLLFDKSVHEISRLARRVSTKRGPI